MADRFRPQFSSRQQGTPHGRGAASCARGASARSDARDAATCGAGSPLPRGHRVRTRVRARWRPTYVASGQSPATNDARRDVERRSTTRVRPENGGWVGGAWGPLGARATPRPGLSIAEEAYACAAGHLGAATATACPERARGLQEARGPVAVPEALGGRTGGVQSVQPGVALAGAPAFERATRAHAKRHTPPARLSRAPRALRRHPLALPRC